AIVVLSPGKQPPAHDLRVGGQQSDPVAMPISHPPSFALLGKGFGELDVSSERLADRTHRRISDVVANARWGPEPDQLALAKLIAGATDSREMWIARREPHLSPDLDCLARRAVLAENIVFEGIVVVVEIEFQQLQSLIFDVGQGAIDSAAVARQMFAENSD